MQKRVLLTVILATITSISASAQTTGLESPVCNAQFAQLMVEQQVMESKSVVEPVKRIKILLRSADFLWKFDEATARAYFAEAYKAADDQFKDKGFEKDKSPRGQMLLYSLPDQRTAVITAISKRDVDWAKRLTEQVLAEYEKTAADRSGPDKTREPGDLLRLAEDSAKTNPELSRYLFRRVMRYPLFVNWYFTFYRLYAVDPAFADSVYSEALKNYSNESPRRLLYLSAYPFANERIFGVDRYSQGIDMPSNIRPHPVLERQFIQTFFQRIATYAASELDINRTQDGNSRAEPIYMVSALREIEPIVIERFPDLLESLGVARSQASSLQSEEMRKQNDVAEEYNNGIGQSFDERISSVEKANGEGKLTDLDIMRLLTWNQINEEQFKKVESWLDKIKEDSVHRDAINLFWFIRSELAIKEKRTDDAEKYAAKVPEIEFRAVLMFELAESQSKNGGDITNLFDTLNRLSKLTHSSDNSVAKAQILLGLANMYEKVSHSIALDELGEAIRVTNSLKEPDIFATTVNRQISGKYFSISTAYSTPGYNLEKTFEELSKKDFEMSLANAKALDDKYFRTLAVIAVATNCAKNAKPVSKPKAKP